MSALSELLNRHFAARFPDESNRAIAKVAGVSRGTIDNYRNGTHPATPGEDILEAFHKLLDIPMGELREAAGQYVGEDAPYVPPAEANRMSIRQRRAVDELIRSIVETRGATDDRAGQSAHRDNPSPAPRAQGAEDQKIKPRRLRSVGSSPEAEPEELPEDPADANAARTRDPQFPPGIPEDDGIGEENQDSE